MPWQGNGTVKLIYNWEQDAAGNIYVRADRMDVQEADIAAMIQNCIPGDGQGGNGGAPTADIPWNGYGITNISKLTSPSGATWTGTTLNFVMSTKVDFTSSISVLVPTLPATDNSNSAASTKFVNSVAMQAALPAQSWNAGKIVTTDGTNASWSVIGSPGQALGVNAAGNAVVGMQIVPLQTFDNMTMGF